METQKKGAVVLVAFYNVKALGVRYLEAAMTKAGYEVTTVFFKRFNSRAPSPATEKELTLLRDLVREKQPVLVGLSVMSSMYLDTIYAVIDALKNEKPPIVCGGAYSSLEPVHLLERGASYVIRLDGEVPMARLADALREGSSTAELPSLCWLEDGQLHVNPIGGMAADLDEYGLPVVNSTGACLIDEDALIPGDPQLDTMSYEVIASRGCPFQCSYCSCVNLRRLYPKGVRPVRTRSVESVIRELEEARKHCHRIAFVHFYDEIFPNLPGWVDEFVEKYHKRIDLPFSIWGHPSMMDGEVLKKLVKVGLVEVIMGIQSGSPHIRKDVFHRNETNDQIAESTRLIHESGVFWASYDFMLQHPFETTDTLRESYELAKRLHGRYELQLHGLNFLPQTDIVPMAIEQGYLTQEEMDAILYAPMGEQFHAYWEQTGDVESRMWYKLLYLWQFPSYRKKCLQWEKAPAAHESEIEKAYAAAQKQARLRYLYKKSRVVLKRVTKHY